MSMVIDDIPVKGEQLNTFQKYKPDMENSLPHPAEFIVSHPWSCARPG